VKKVGEMPEWIRSEPKEKRINKSMQEEEDHAATVPYKLPFSADWRG
jgi:hypothetical protein